jgi:hypothetical protein
MKNSHRDGAPLATVVDKRLPASRYGTDCARLKVRGPEAHARCAGSAYTGPRSGAYGAKPPRPPPTSLRESFG